MTIEIIVRDENLNFLQRVETGNFEIATMQLGSLERNYNRRVEMETKEESDF